MRTTMCRKFMIYTNFAIYYKHNVTLRLRYLFFTILQCKYFLNHRLTLNWALNLKLKANQHSPPAAANQLKKIEQAKKDYKFWKPKIHNRSPKVSYFYYKNQTKFSITHYFSNTVYRLWKLYQLYIHFTISLSPLYCRKHSPCHSLSFSKVDEFELQKVDVLCFLLFDDLLSVSLRLFLFKT